jgi:hypothetical protein
MSQFPRKHETLFLVVAVFLTATLIFSLGYRRRQNYLALADHHLAEMAASESVSKSDGHIADMFEGKAPREQIFAFLMPVDSTDALRANERLYASRASYHAALNYKYREAAAHPWTSVEPDPPSP